jgi:predicted O-methyltransferase YrrM
VTDIAMPPISGTSVSRQEWEKLYELARGKTVLELGTWFGFSACIMAQSAAKVHVVDWFCGDAHAGYEPDQLQNYLVNTDPYDNIVTHIGRFEEVLPLFAPKTFGFCFLDGYHTEGATRWAARWAKRLTNGPLAFHDYGVFTGVDKVVDGMGGPKELVGTLAVL